MLPSEVRAALDQRGEIMMSMKTYCEVLNTASKVAEECKRARKNHPPLHSTHEAHSVIKEEFDEWWDSVKADKPDDDELIQVAAMAIMAIVELKGQCVNPAYKNPEDE